jgi:putative ABC transport system permease protein
MIRNYLLTALRVLSKNTLFSAINIIGLSIGLAASIIIYLWVYDELSFDRFHENADRIYRVERDMEIEEERMHVPITAPPVGPKMMEDYPQVEAFVRIARDNVQIEDDNRDFINERMIYADSSFFNFFSFGLVEGSKDCLVEPFTIAISESYAEKYFGGAPGPGSVLNVNYQGTIRPFTVTAVFADFPHNSHLQADLIGSFSSLYSIRHEQMMFSWMASSIYTYVLLDQNTDVTAFENNIQELVDDYFAPEFRAFIDFDDPRELLRLELMPLTDIYLNANRVWEMESPGSRTSVMVFSLVSLLLLIIAGINFMNLSTARASRRALEVGVRKVAGASKPQLVRQFLGESTLYSFLALVMAIILIELALPWFSQFTGKSLSLSMIFAGRNPLIIVVAWLALAFLPVHILRFSFHPTDLCMY